jgi:hypothetical protein
LSAALPAACALIAAEAIEPPPAAPAASAAKAIDDAMTPRASISSPVGSARNRR